MAESGSTEDQMEFFIMNNQKLSKFPNEESQWSLVFMPSAEGHKDVPTSSSGLSLDDLNQPPKPTVKKFGNNSSRPPVNWKNAPELKFALKTKAFILAQIRKDVTEELFKEYRNDEENKKLLLSMDIDEILERKAESFYRLIFKKCKIIIMTTGHGRIR
ncbi:hypothetical protein L6452_01841 [Arctium lappa]|uniref:Uncharacterized protein n=1 Tax=Arctium lappa TaxID=4217 RepID=A0ACB9FHS8_ARCLA|nr:hypothetical protein L6452_01841 [Arctium lappa]